MDKKSTIDKNTSTFEEYINGSIKQAIIKTSKEEKSLNIVVDSMLI